MKKYFYYLMTAMLVTMLSVGFASCGSDDDDDGSGGGRDAAVVGTWYDKTHGKYIFGWRFDSNGVCYYYEWGNGQTNINLTDHPFGKWSTKDGILTIIDEGYDDGEYYKDIEEYKYMLLENGKTMELYEDNKLTYTLQKQ